MIRILNKIPKKVSIACSGGPDSMAILDFLRKGSREIDVVHFYHKTSHSSLALEVVEKYCKEFDLRLIVDEISREKNKDESQEEFWRNERIKFLRQIDNPVITGHNLDDVIEWWIFTSLHGDPRLIPYRHDNIIRPFLMTKKSILLEWANDKGVPFVCDPSNKDLKYARSRIRNAIIPQTLAINPGFHKVLKKKIENEFSM